MLTIAPATDAQRSAALALLFAALPHGEHAEAAARTRMLLDSAELDPAGLLLASRGGEPCGVILCNLAAGAAGLVWPPRVAGGGTATEIEDALLQTALTRLHDAGARLAQCLLSACEHAVGPALERNGLARLTTLLFLRHALDHFEAIGAGTAQLYLQSLTDADHALFAQTLERTYLGTLDCPELNDVRTIDEVLAGHRAQGLFDAQRWLLAFFAGQPVGVLLANALRDLPVQELVYVGVTPEARGKGLGRQLVLRALAEARNAGASCLTLAVDARNTPARRLYAQLGFEVWDEREAFLHVFAR